MSYFIRHSCRLCGSSVTRCVIDFGQTALANDYPAALVHQETYPLYLNQCESCGHVQCPVVVDPAVLFTEYSYASGLSKSFREHLQSVASFATEWGDTIVDIGSNDGTLVRLCAEVPGTRAIGVDPARNLAAEASKNGALTIPAFFTPDIANALCRLLGPVDVVTALNVFAHADDLGAIADGARLLLEDDGMFLFEVAYLPDILAANEFGSVYHEHLSHHHLDSLVPFLRRHGLNLTEATRVNAQGGSIRCVATPLAVGEDVSPQVEDMLREERANLPALLAAWPQRVKRQVERDLAQVMPYRGTLAVYGAPARSCTYFAQLGLTRNDVQCVFDDEPRKRGRYTPGMKWPIVSSSELMARNPEAVFIAAWPYAEEIMARFPDYRGKWILPDRADA